MLLTVDSNTPFDVVFIDFWGPGDIPDQDGSRKILTCLDCMTGFGLWAAIGMEKITSDQFERWDFGNFFVPFGSSKMIVVNANGMFLVCPRKLFKRPYSSQ